MPSSILKLAQLVTILQSQPATAKEIVQATKLRPSCVGHYIEELREHGYIRPVGYAPNTHRFGGGTRATQWKWDKQ